MTVFFSLSSPGLDTAACFSMAAIATLRGIGAGLGLWARPGESSEVFRMLLVDLFKKDLFKIFYICFHLVP